MSYRIVVGFDYSRLSELALRSAFDLASKESMGEVHVVTVLVQMGDFIAHGMAGPLTPEILPIQEAYEALEARVGQSMSSWQSETGRSFSRLAVHVRSEMPATEIAQLATDLEAQLVVIGTHGRRGVNRLLLGSVAEGVVRLAECPVLVVREPKAEPKVPEIEPPCPECLKARRATAGKELWCEQHRGRHGQRHTYHYESRVAQPTNPPLFIKT